MRLSFYINFILQLEDAPLLTEKESFDIDNFDKAVLILDDIKDGSKKRDGQPCLYLVIGVERAQLEAVHLKKKAYEAIETLCIVRQISVEKRLKAENILNFLLKDIQVGELIDSQLQNEPLITNHLLEKYKTMTKLFTGGHIKWGFQLGFLFSKKEPSFRNDLAEIAENIGMLRQIRDDINDYSEIHHEPLGDLTHHKNRLPELLFLLTASDEETQKLKKLLIDPRNNLGHIRELIFNKKVNQEIQGIVSEIKESIQIKLKKLPENYQNALEDLMKKFI